VEITVVITNYNYGKFLGRCLRSVLNQSIDESQYEVIVVDDASTDDSREILNAYKPSVKSIFLESNSGLAFASNTGIRAAQGRYIVRVDADDYVHYDFLRTLLIGFEFFGKDYQAVALDYFNVLDSGEYLSYGNSVEFPIACAIAFKLDALEQIGFYNSSLRLNEEVELRSRFLEEGFKIRHINLPLYRYVNHDTSLTRRVLI
jgi:glycosyltransferase involved in cell wall biosynthesis